MKLRFVHRCVYCKLYPCGFDSLFSNGCGSYTPLYTCVQLSLFDDGDLV